MKINEKNNDKKSLKPKKEEVGAKEIVLNEEQTKALNTMFKNFDGQVAEEVYDAMYHLMFFARHSGEDLKELSIKAITLVDFYTNLWGLSLTEEQQSKLKK